MLLHAEPLQDQRDRAVDVARADREHEVARARGRETSSAPSSSEGAQPTGMPGPDLAEAVDDELPVDALERRLPGRIDLGHDGEVGEGERVRELARRGAACAR